jgi:hypothetical protein
MERHSAPAGMRSGVLISTPEGSDKVVCTDTIMCCHCGRHWLYQPGCGKKRGRCLRCNGFTCGSRKCDTCVPLEQRLENWEKGAAEDHRPIIVAV